MSNTNTAQQTECCICLQATQHRNGFQFLTTPGCCGKLFHQSCLTDFMNNGGKDCPHCRTTLPTAAVPPLVATPSWQSSTRLPSMISNPTYQVEDTIAPPVEPSVFGESPKVVGNLSSSSEASTAEDVSPKLKLRMVPEFPVEGFEGNPDFNVRISVEFEDDEEEAAFSKSKDNRNPLDVVCVLDVSGSMIGDKLMNLKKAIEFVLSVLNSNDRLSLVTFSSQARTVTNLKSMTSEMKLALKEEVLPSIHANGGTDIYAGLEEGSQILKNRLSKNAHSIMFLLTDGQDKSRMEEKKEIVKAMRAQHGTSLFVFGFGTDHDSEHLLEIGNACEGNFIYVDTNERIVEAFGGAIGSQQGHLLRNITLSLATQSPSVAIQSVSSGIYANQITAAGTSASISLMDLFRGEKRDFLVSLAIPVVTTEINAYHLMSVSGTFSVVGGANDNSTDAIMCQIQRLGPDNEQLPHLHVRNPLVDEDIFRIRCKDAMATAINRADNDLFAEAKETLQNAMSSLTGSSIAYLGGSELLRGMMKDLQDCLVRTQSREEYNYRGGKAMISEHHDGYTKQRKMLGKSNASAYYQTHRSRCVQELSTVAVIPNTIPNSDSSLPPVIAAIDGDLAEDTTGIESRNNTKRRRTKGNDKK